VTRRAFSSQLAVAASSTLAAALAEACVSASRLSNAPADAVLAAVWTLGLWALPSALGAVGLAWLLTLLCDDDSLLGMLRDQWAMPLRRDALLVGMFAAPALLGWVFVLASASARFHNVELAAALVSVAVVFGVVVLSIAGAASFRGLERLRAGGRKLGFLPLAALAFKVSVVAWLGFECRAGLAQLDLRLLAAPLAFLLVFVSVDGSAWVRARARYVLLPLAAVGLLAWSAFLFGGAKTRVVPAVSGAWSPVLIVVVQQLTDFDRDGYSSFLGGADCAPFDAQIGPGAAEIAGDGIDNNCIGGDAGKSAAVRRPNWGPSAHGSPMNLNVVIVTIETLRRDHASFVHARNDTTPTLRSLAGESLVFDRMYSAAPMTRLAIASLFSSYAPSEIDWQRQDAAKKMRRIGPQTPWLPELLRVRGYETIAVLTDFSAFTPQEDAGFERGFLHYDVSTRLAYRGGTMGGFPSAEQVDKALGYLEHAERPFMLWLHLFEPHFSYEQPPDAPVFGQDEQSRYDAEIWHADHQLGRLIAGLKKLGAWNDTVLFVSGDHGEAFGEHQDRWHGSNLFDPQLRPAALLRVPGVVGKHVDVGVTFTDVAPTIARVLGDRQTFDQLRGRSLAPLMHHRTLPDDENGFVAESFSVDDGHAYQAALVASPLKLIYVEAEHRFSFFDLERDPSEQNPRDPRVDPRAAPLLRELLGYLERTHARSVVSPAAKP
jgi:arylsulfatase A-like enzyme